jgi:4-hydroxyphenylpyruvate dioxygenase-like putative hemolysin
VETNIATLTFERAVRLFRQWGFQVEKGPRPKEVTLILQGPDHRSCYVYEMDHLPQIAAVALRVRMANGASEEPSARRMHSAVH